MIALRRVRRLRRLRRLRRGFRGLHRYRRPFAKWPKSVCDEGGMATAEFAVVLPAVVLVLVLSLGALGLAWDQIRCVDAARAGARAASRGDSPGAVILVASRAAPSGAYVSMGAAGELVQVSVESRPRVAATLLPDWLRASSTASAVREQPDLQQ